MENQHIARFVQRFLFYLHRSKISLSNVQEKKKKNRLCGAMGGFKFFI